MTIIGLSYKIVLLTTMKGYRMNEQLNKAYNEIKTIEIKTDFIVSWFAKKYNKTIFRVGNLNEDGCRVWETDGKKYMCFWDTVLERYTTCINPEITYKRKVN